MQVVRSYFAVVFTASVLLCACAKTSTSTSDATPLAASDPTTAAKLQELRKANTTNPQWVIPQHSPHADTAVVFVHGIFGDTLGTWLNGTTGKHFYDLVASDPALGPNVDLFAYGFPSTMLGHGSFTIGEAANRLVNDLEYYKVLTYPHIVFVAHSMGGLVVMQALLTKRPLLSKVPVLVFLATPQEGAQITLLARRLLNNPALDEMLPADHNSYLQTLNDQWRSIPPNPLPHISCAFEKLPIAGVTIVPWSSATRFCDGPAAAVLADHSDIAKPPDTNSDSYITLANALTGYAFPATAADSAKGSLETPDFKVVDGKAELVISDPRGKRDVHIVNSGPGRLRYILEQFPDSGLYVTPDIGPRYVEAAATDVFSLIVGYGSTESSYTFKLASTGGPALPVTVRIPNLQVVQAFHAQLAGQLADNLITKFGAGSPGSRDTVANAAAEVVAKNYDNPPAGAKWLIAAGLLQSVNWPTEAVSALRQAESANPKVLTSAGTLRLAAITGYLSGQSNVFQNVHLDPQNTTVVTGDTGFLSEHPNLLATAALRAKSTSLAQVMANDPAVADLGRSLEGDLALSAGDFPHASTAYSQALVLNKSPSLELRLANAQLGALKTDDALKTLKRNLREFPGALSEKSTQQFQEVAIKEDRLKKPIT